MLHLDDQKIEDLEKTANQIRQDIIEELVEAGSGHTAGPLGMTDVFTALYFHILKHDPKNPSWSNRDRLVLSNGHICPVLYATMARAGYFPLEEVKTLRKFGTRLQGHPHRTALPGLETTSGPLGSGLSQAVGMAIAARMAASLSAGEPPATSEARSSERRPEGRDTKRVNIYCLMSDGEQECGQTWEAAMLAGKLKLDNLTALIDRNNIQIDGMTEQIMPLEPLRAKYEAFNWHVLEMNGHDFKEIVNAFETAKAIYEKPVLIIAHTIPGKGVPEIEFDFRWHGVPPGFGPTDIFKKEDQGKEFLARLRTLDGKITSEHE